MSRIRLLFGGSVVEEVPSTPTPGLGEAEACAYYCN